jgi:hypothetical protein
MDESYDWTVVGARQCGIDPAGLKASPERYNRFAATGNSSALVMGRYYVGAGTSIGAPFIFGAIAARHAANADNLAA